MSVTVPGTRSISAAWPEIRPPVGTTTTDVMPSLRAGVEQGRCGLIPSHTGNEAATPLSPRGGASTVACTAPISLTPRPVLRIDQILASPTCRSRRCAVASSGTATFAPTATIFPSRIEHGPVLDRRSAHRINLAASDRDGLRDSAGDAGVRTENAMLVATTHPCPIPEFPVPGSHVSLPSIRNGHVSELEIRPPPRRRIRPVVGSGAVDPHVLGARIHAERIAGPQHDVARSCRPRSSRSCRRARSPTPD